MSPSGSRPEESGPVDAVRSDRVNDHGPEHPERARGISGLGNEESAEHLRERVYGSVSVLAVLASLLYDEDRSAGAAIASVAITAGSLWAASLFADFTGHLAAHQKFQSRREVLALLSSRAQILSCAVIPVLLLAAAAFGWWGTHGALAASAWVEVVTLGLVGMLAVRGVALPFLAKVALVAAEVALGLLIVLVKFLAH